MSVKVHEAFSIDSFQDRLLWWDDFLGDQLQNEWNEAGVGSAAVVDAQTGGIVRLTTGATTADSYRIDWQNYRSLLVTKKVTMEVRAKLTQTTLTSESFRLWFDAANYIRFNHDTAISGNWFIRCVDAAAGADLDSGIAADTFYHIFRIECHIHGGSHVHFYIDNVQTANSPIGANIPDDGTDYLQPYLGVRTLEDATKSMDVDYVVVRQEI